jgi:tetratricopeptide (TPR) repeat protein
LIGLHRISLITSQFEQAAGYLDRLKLQANKTDVGVLMEEVAQHVMLGRNSEAIPLLENVVKLEPANMQAWSALASLMVADNRVQEFKAVVKKLKRNRTLPGNLKVLLGKLLMQKREYREALNLLEQVTLTEPANINAWELLLRIDVYEGDRFRAEERVRRLLNVDPENGYGNEVLGSIQFQQRKFSAAAASYQASLRSERTPEALNSLAYVYAVTRHYEDAFPLVMESLELNPRSAPAWDTLAMVQFGLNAYEDASKSILEALTIVPNQPVYLFHQAQIFAKSGRPEQALKIANDLNAIIHNLPSDIQSELIDFLLQLRRTE